MTDRKVLITGGGGFIGSLVTKAARQHSGWTVYVTVRDKNKYRFDDDVKVVEADLLEETSREAVLEAVRPDTLIHLAWGFSAAKEGHIDNDITWLNASLSLLEGFARCGGRRFVFAGTALEYGENGGRCAETAAAAPGTMYAKCKRSFSEIAAAYCAQRQIEFAVARLFSVYGGSSVQRMQGMTSAILSFLEKKPFLCKAPHNVWDLVHVEDVARALVRIAGSGYCGIVNVGTGTPHIMGEVYAAIAEKLNCRELLSFADNKTAQVCVADPAILREEIGYSCDIGLEEGLAQTIEWWQSHYRD